MIDKRKVRRDLADMFSTTADGVRGSRAKEWGLVNEIVKPQQFAEYIKQRALTLAQSSDRPADAQGISLTPLEKVVNESGLHYRYVNARIHRDRRLVELTVRGPEKVEKTIEEAFAAGANWWPLQMARELDDAILHLRTNETELGLWTIRATGDPEAMLAMDKFILSHRDNWFVRETLGMMRRTFSRLDVSSRSIYAFVEPGSCFAGTLLELAFAADRVYMLDVGDGPGAASIVLSEMNFGPLPMANGLARLSARFYSDADKLDALHALMGKPLNAAECLEAGLVTVAPDEIDWADEVRQAIESRVALSPDALTGLEANLRFGLPETMSSRIFGRLSAWQNWIFIRPNAVGESGALKIYGTGAPVKFNWERV